MANPLLLHFQFQHRSGFRGMGGEVDFFEKPGIVDVGDAGAHLSRVERLSYLLRQVPQHHPVSGSPVSRDIDAGDGPLVDLDAQAARG